MALMRTEGASNFSSKSIGLQSPRVGSIWEFFVCGEISPVIMSEIFKILSKHRISTLMVNGYHDDHSKTFSMSLCLDLTKSNCSADELLLELRDTQSVERVDKLEMSGQLFDSYLHPLTIANRFSVVAMGIDPLVNTEKRLNEVIGTQGVSIMFEEGRSYGSDLIARLKEALGPKPQKSNFIQNVANALKAMGWGMFEFRLDREILEVLAWDFPPPLNSETPSLSGCSFVYGLVAGVLERTLGYELSVREVSFDKKSQVLKLYLTPKKEGLESLSFVQKKESRQKRVSPEPKIEAQEEEPRREDRPAKLEEQEEKAKAPAAAVQARPKSAVEESSPEIKAPNNDIPKVQHIQQEVPIKVQYKRAPIQQEEGPKLEASAATVTEKSPISKIEKEKEGEREEPKQLSPVHAETIEPSRVSTVKEKKTPQFIIAKQQSMIKKVEPRATTFARSVTKPKKIVKEDGGDKEESDRETENHEAEGKAQAEESDIDKEDAVATQEVGRKEEVSDSSSSPQELAFEALDELDSNIQESSETDYSFNDSQDSSSGEEIFDADN